MDSRREFSKKTMRRTRIIIFILIAIAAIGIAHHIVEYVFLRLSTNNKAVLPVNVTLAAPEHIKQELILPGNVTAWHEATIFARSDGYVVNWMVDIGAHVKKDELLAELTAPEVVAQLRQTEADLLTAEANYNLAQITAKRWVFLLKTHSVSKQEADEKVSDAQAKAAIVASTRAQRDRLRDLVSFQKIVAPFDGIIMSRTTDIGHLINAGSGTVPLFRIIQVNPLRIYVRVPEYYARYMTKNIEAKLYFTEHPGKFYPAVLLDTANGIDLSTRTLLVQLTVPNENYELLAGSYTQVHFVIPADEKSIILPVGSLIFRSKGLQVAVVDKDNKVELKSITLGTDYGDKVEVTAGLVKNEKVILNPSDTLFSGQQIHIVSTETANSSDIAAKDKQIT